MEKNDSVIGEVLSLASAGEGVIKQDGVTLFAPGCLPGEKVRLKVLKVKGGVGYAKVEEVLTPSPARVAPKCPVFLKCGGCQLQHLAYEEQLAFKQKLVQENLQKIGGISAEVSPCVRSESEWGYRNKLQLPVGEDTSGNLVLGFFAERSHRIVPIENCPLHPSWAEKLIKAFRSFLRENGISAYSEEKKTGEIRHLVVRDLGGKAIVTVVSTKGKLKNYERLAEKLTTVFPEYTLVLNVNDKDTNVVFGEKFIPLVGGGRFDDTALGIVYEADSNTFLQVNGSVRNKLYSYAFDALGCDENSVVFDCYAGGGLLTAMIAKRSKRAYGIEIVKEANASAEALKRKNSLEGRMINICGDVAEVLPKLMEEEKGEKISLVLDPPRAGIARSVLKAILKAKIPKLVLISCNPSTLARDLGILTGTLTETEKGELVKADGDVKEGDYYRIETVTPFDMFPQTRHVETLVCLSKKSEKHISIDVEFGESDGQISLKKLQKELNEQKLKKKTTYKDIQKWVEENYGFKVHTAYIAEVKRDLGLPMYDAPNAVEELKRPRSHPTAEMSDAIKAALKHFEII